MRYFGARLLAACLLLVLPPAVHAGHGQTITRDPSGRVTVRAVRVQTPLKIDGALDEPLYTSVQPIS